jgi:hypothetical protein
MDLAIALLSVLLCGAAALWFLGIGISERFASRGSLPDRGIDPIVGPRDRLAIYDRDGPFIPMPDRLKTHDEMVAWMTQDLPKLTARKRASNT